MLTSHALLQKYRYDARFRFDAVTVWYRDRGAHGDCSSADGPAIIALTDQFLELRTPHGVTSLPYHRLLRISCDGDLIWQR